jgi:hypothetical protein
VQPKVTHALELRPKDPLLLKDCGAAYEQRELRADALKLHQTAGVNLDELREAGTRVQRLSAKQ